MGSVNTYWQDYQSALATDDTGACESIPKMADELGQQVLQVMGRLR